MASTETRGAVPTWIASRYRVEAPLGEGGSATAFRARDALHGDAVALKILRSTAPELEAALLTELELLGRLFHPRVAQVVGFGQVSIAKERRLFHASRLVEGPELAEVGSWERAAPALLDALEGLRFLHAHGVRHGDLTPRNVRLDGAGRALLLDFGCARAIGEASDVVSGTPGFLAPELLRGEPADGRADLFAFGACVDALEARLGPAPGDLSRIAHACRGPLAGRPSGAAEVLERLGAADRARGEAGPEASALLGRGAIVARFDAALDALVRGAAGVRAIALVGVEGSGRTRLLRELTRRALARVPVVEAWPQAARPLAPWLGEADGVDGAAEALEASRRRGDAQLWVIDDADRLTPPARRTLDAIARGLEPTDPVLLLVAGALPTDSAREERLAPLAEAEVRRWAEGRVDPSSITSLMAQSGGHPGTVRRLLGEALAAPLERASSRARVPDAPAERALLGWLAASERSWSLAGLRAAEQPLDGLEGLAARGWVKVEGGSVQLARPADAPAIERALGDAATRRTHARLAETVAGPMRAAHWLRAGDEGAAAACAETLDGDDPLALRAAEVLAEARDPRLRLAAARALERRGHPARALEALEALDATDRDVAIRVASCALKLERADRVLEALAALPPDDPEAADLRARARIKRGEYAAAIDAIAPAPREGLTGGLLEESLGVAKSYLGEPDAAAHLARAERALASGRPADRLRALSYLGIDAYRRGDLEAAGAAYAQALEVAERDRLEDGIAHAALNLGTVAHQRGDYGVAARAYRRAHRIARALGQRATLATIELDEAQLYCDLGVWDRAAASLARARQLAEEASAGLLLGACDVTAGELALGRGAPEDALDALDAAEARLASLGAERERAEVTCHRVEALTRLGRHDEAKRVLESLEAPRSEDLLPRRDLAAGRRALADGDAGEAGRRLESAAARADALGLRALSAAAHASLADAWEARAMEGLAERHRREARERWERCAADLDPALLDAFWAHPARARAARPAPATGARELQLERLLALHRGLVSTTDEREVLRRGLDAAIELTGAERGFLIVRDGDRLEVPVARNLDRERIGRSHLKFSRSIAERVMETGELVVTVDARSDDRFREHASVHAMKLRSVIAAPIPSPEGAAGALYLDNRFLRDRFREVDRDLLRAFADHLGIALRNARLVSQLEARTAELEAERARVVRRSEDQASQIERLETELAQRRGPSRRYGAMIADAPAMQPVLHVLDRVVASPLSVLVQGESGTGKELIARAAHDEGPRAEGPFVTVNCAALPDALLESELFGHVRGAFTGADRDHEGLMVSAEGGTLFLDEIGETSLTMQAKLLRALEERRVRPVGGSASRAVDFRLVCATNRELSDEVAAGRFREDLYYRVGVVTLRLPPLRERLEDLPALCREILARASEELDRPPARLTAAAVRRLLAEPWPGNVRQLQNVLRRAAVLTASDVIDVEHLALGDATARPPVSRRERDAREKARMLEALAATDWNVTAAAARASMSRATFYRKLKRHGIR